MKRLSSFTLTLSVVACVCALAFACSDEKLEGYCTGIPAHGCPGLDTSTCTDTTCEAIYSHSPSCVWTFVTTCPGYVAPPDASATHDASSDAGSDVVLRDAGFTLPEGARGGPGCEDLEEPDCSVALGASCDDCCGCQDLYVCVQGGWNLWGECSDAGKPVPTPSGN